MTDALAIRHPAPLGGYQPPPDRSEFASLAEMANNLAKARGFIPAHFDSQPFKILAAMLYGRDLGISPTNALQHIIVIEGKATADAQLIGMLVRRAGHRLEDTTTDVSSTVRITRGDDATEHEFSFSMQDAQRAGLVRQGSAWQKYPKSMLYARALTGCARKGAQDALMGVIYTPEELGAEVDEEGAVVALPPFPLDQASPASQEAVASSMGMQGAPSPAASGVPEATVGTQLPTAAAIQPASPAPSASVQQQPEGESPQGTGVETSPATTPPTAVPAQQAPFNPAPLSGASVSRRMGRSIGPQAKRTNVVTAEQAAEKPATAPEVPASTQISAEVISSQPAPSALTDEPIPPQPVDDGHAVFVESLRTDLRERAATLARLNAITRNHLVHALKGEEPEEVPPATPSKLSDESLQNLIERDFPGRTLATLGEAELQNRLELIEPFISKRRDVLKEKGITEE